MSAWTLKGLTELPSLPGGAVRLRGGQHLPDLLADLDVVMEVHSNPGAEANFIRWFRATTFEEYIDNVDAAQAHGAVLVYSVPKL
ncbi:MAG TPA: hypothetical protein VHQ86_04025 [Candidatus Saccharimonadia bacterium]|nr:hypothetical protein [Candidatus Saccharimonadia bacterium]